MRLILQFLIISIGCIKRRRRIMSEYSVLRYHRSGDRLGIFIKQAVVAHTQSDDNVQVRLRMVQHLRLKDRVAHIDSDLVAALRNPNVRFGRGACLTGNPNTVKPRLRKIAARVRLSFKSPTQVAMPIFFAPILSAKAMISSTRVYWQ